MGLTPISPRDRVLSAVALGQKIWRYRWLIAVFAVVGAALSLAFAFSRPDKFTSSATLFYQERIQSQLLSPGREEAATRNLGDRFRELLLARPQLGQIVADPSLDPFPDEPSRGLKIDKLRLHIRFGSRGAGAFRIEYTDGDPERARRVTEKLTELLQDKDEALRNTQAAATVKFAIDEHQAEAAVLQQHEQALAEFLAQNPEFAAQIAHPPIAVGPQPADRRLQTLIDQAVRIQKLLDAPADAPAVAVPRPSDPVRLAAEAQLARAQHDVQAAEVALRDVLSKFTNLHPSAITAQDRLDRAKEWLRMAEAAVPPIVEPIVRPTTQADRARLEDELRQLQAQIAQERSRTRKTGDAADLRVKHVVELETKNSNLRRAVSEHRERVQLLAEAVFRTTMDAKQKLAEQGRLSVIDPAFTPVLPTGPGKTILLLAGMLVFLALGVSLAVALAVIDDRLYRRVDLDRCGVRMLAVIPAEDPHKHK
jgi:succinoglycan biosynthesis transport protein ExoP